MVYPCASNYCLELLAASLRFNSAFRITAADALIHPFFDRIKEQGYIHQDLNRSDGVKDRISTANKQNSHIQPYDAQFEDQSDQDATVRCMVR